MESIILASGSPRRKELLNQLGIEFEVIPADVDETLEEGLSPEEAVKQLSLKKAAAVAKMHPGKIVLGADTVVAYDGEILGKPEDENDALDMLLLLSGRTHHVYTGVALIYPDGKVKSFSESTEVVMYENDRQLIKEYIATGEPMDKAGAYGIQGMGAILVKEIRGDYNNVVGLPVARITRILKNLE